MAASGEIPVTEERKNSWEKFRGEDPLQEAMEAIGLTPRRAAECLAEELEATTVRVQVVDEVDVVEIGDDKTPTIITRKVWSMSPPMVDWPTRQKARQDIVKLWGSMPKGKDGDQEDREPLVLEIKQYAEPVSKE